MESTSTTRDETTEAEEEEGTKKFAGGWRPLVSEIMARGWWLGKRLAITGAAIASTPVVLPPLCVVSAIGFALALPFGAMAAALAGTEKAMGRLLPISEPREEDLEAAAEEEEEPLDESKRVAEAAMEDEGEIGVKRMRLGAAAEDEEAGGEDRAAPAVMVVVAETEPEGPAEAVEGVYNEEKIWEEINAMRSIVGYTAALQASYIEEIKALYLFTGVEPPPISSEVSDAADDGLKFLKSVVGVV